MVMAAVVIVAIIVVFQAAIKNIHPGSLAQTTPAQPAVPTIPQLTPQSPTGSSPSRPSYPGAGQKPGGIILDYGAGYITFSTIAAYEARGFDATGAILFDKIITQDGIQSANWTLQNAQVDYIDLYSFNGITRIMNPLVSQTFSTTNVGEGNSGSLVGPGMAPVGETASTSPAAGSGAVMVPYPAGDPNYSLPQPVNASAYDPNASWFQTGNYLASIGSGA